MIPIIPILGVVTQLIDRVIPDPAEREKAKAALVELEQKGELQEMQIKLSAIIMEAKSEDPWTSRARPSFLYVIYILILMSIPMGFLSAFSPETASAVSDGFRAWLSAIPSDLYGLFGFGYLGYVGSRSYDKKKILEAK